MTIARLNLICLISISFLVVCCTTDACILCLGLVPAAEPVLADREATDGAVVISHASVQRHSRIAPSEHRDRSVRKFPVQMTSFLPSSSY